MDWSPKMEESGTNLILGLLQGIWNAMKNIWQWVDEHIFGPFIDAFKAAFRINSPSKVMEEMGGYIIEGFLNGIKNGFNFIKDTVGTIIDIFQSIIPSAKQIWDDVGNGLSSAFQHFGETAHGWLQNVIDGLNHVISKAGQALSGLNQVANKRAAEIEADGSQYLTGFASGGFPDEGQLFMAREGGMPELVGRVGNHTAVANNDQIVAGISNGVYNAVVSAMSISGGGGSNTPVEIYLDGNLIAKSTTRYQRQYARAGTM